MSSATKRAQPLRAPLHPPTETRMEIRAPADLVDALRSVAAANDRSMAAEVRRALAEHIRRENAAA